ncbi:MAG: hypothetical protein M3478_14850 [Planctomycetota bacterium]|nr:hypothetical protein [Planctomycetota bacterium]
MAVAMRAGQWLDVGAGRAINPDAFAGAITDGNVIEFYLTNEAPALNGKYRFSGDVAKKLIAAMNVR